jgi:GT2 family glycosyltransferase
MTNKNLAGHIDSFEGGVLRGWAADLGSETPIEILACDEAGKLLGMGTANEYREDLSVNKINNGEHGFSIVLNNELLRKESAIVIKDRNTAQKIATSKFKVSNSPGRATVSLESLVGNKLSFAITNNHVADGAFILAFRVENEIIGQYECDGSKALSSGYIYIPAKLLDNVSRTVVAFVFGEPAYCGMLEIQGDPILTPWEYLNHSRKLPNYIAKPPSADSRYESLTLQLSDNSRNADIESISVAHSVLVEGFEGRKNYPVLTLPNFETPKVSIIVPAYNKFSLTYHCIASVLLAYNETSYEVILADDCSTDETTKAEELITNLKVSRNTENLRFLKSCNKATDIATGEYIVFLNNDTEVKSLWLDELIKQHESDTGVGVTGSKLLNLDGTLQEAGGIVWSNGEPWNAGRNANSYDCSWNYVRQVDYVTGAALCISRDVWEEVGRFSEEYAPCYYEDTDLSFKVRNAGYKVLYVPHSEVIHFEGQSHGTDVSKGLKQYQKVNEATFRRAWFNSYKQGSKPSLTNLHLDKDRNIEQRILVIDYATPMEGVDAGSHAALKEIEMMLALGFKVTFVPQNLAIMGLHTKKLQNMGVEVLYVPFYYSLDDVLDRRLEEMDAVYITRYEVAKNYIERIKEEKKPVLFNNADLHFLREIRSALLTNDQAAMEEALLTRDEELAVCEEVDAILTYNTTEQAVISSHLASTCNMHTTPWVVDPKPTGKPFSARSGIAFLGGYGHKPNVEAVEFMVSQVMPKLKLARPDITFTVYGSKMPKEFEKFACENVDIVGFAENLDQVYNEHRIFIAPLLSGAGIKGKVLDALAYATPTVLTDVAAEGTGLTHGINTLIANDSEAWVQAIIKLYDDEVLWTRFSDNSRLLAEENYSFVNGVSKFKKIFESVGIFTSI